MEKCTGYKIIKFELQIIIKMQDLTADILPEVLELPEFSNTISEYNNDLESVRNEFDAIKRNIELLNTSIFLNYKEIKKLKINVLVLREKTMDNQNKIQVSENTINRYITSHGCTSLLFVCVIFIFIGFDIFIK